MKATRFPGELEALESARAIGRRWGYGNVMQYLQQAWDKELQESSLKFAHTLKGREKVAFVRAWKKHFNKAHSLLKEDQS